MRDKLLKTLKWAGITNPQRLMQTALTAFICVKALEGMTQITEMLSSNYLLISTWLFTCLLFFYIERLFTVSCHMFMLTLRIT